MSDTGDYATTFALMDMDGDGLITVTELHEMLTALGGDVTETSAARAVEVMDTDGDGKVSLEELTAYLKDPATGGGPA